MNYRFGLKAAAMRCIARIGIVPDSIYKLWSLPSSGFEGRITADTAVCADPGGADLVLFRQNKARSPSGGKAVGGADLP